jgi:hypothetical protein
MRLSKARHNFGLASFFFSFFPLHTPGRHEARTQLLHCFYTTGCHVTVHRDVVLEFILVHATELFPVLVEIVVIVGQYDVTIA